jgi:hypothetical protein
VGRGGQGRGGGKGLEGGLLNHVEDTVQGQGVLHRVQGGVRGPFRRKEGRKGGWEGKGGGTMKRRVSVERWLVLLYSLTVLKGGGRPGDSEGETSQHTHRGPEGEPHRQGGEGGREGGRGGVAPTR